MRSYLSVWLAVSTLITPLVTVCGQAPPAAEPAKAGKSKPAAAANSNVSNKSTAETTAVKQRETALAAMQKSVDKQKAAVAAGLAAMVGKQGLAANPGGKDSFFLLAPLSPPAANAGTGLALPESTMPDVDCAAVPESSVAPVLLEAAQREGLEPKLLTAVIEQESAFRPCAISDKGAQGLMQLMPETTERLTVKDPFDAKQNIDAGAKYLKELLTRYNGNLGLALGAYNAGPDKVDQANGIPNIPETTSYVNAILTKLGMQPPAASVPAAAAAPPVDPAPPTPPQL
jgi:soluble lytic murein transglycosylase-like protein